MRNIELLRMKVRNVNRDFAPPHMERQKHSHCSPLKIEDIMELYPGVFETDATARFTDFNLCPDVLAKGQYCVGGSRRGPTSW